MKVAKFGGSSVKDALSMRRCANIVAKDSSLGLVIISATYNTTNLLEEICSLTSLEAGASSALAKNLVDRHSSMAKELGLNAEQLKDYAYEAEKLLTSITPIELSKSCDPRQKDLILSWGERVSSFLFYCVLENLLDQERQMSWLDACDYIATDSSFGLAKPLTEKIKYRVESIIKKPFEGGELFVTQGFIGRDELGNVTTLGREGSDYSAALFAQALEALEVQIWTDVNGIFECDPNIVAHARKIPYMSYDQATRMAKSGAKVLFGKTLSPLREQQIPVFVRNSQEPLDEGSLISFKPFQGKDLLSVCIKKRSDGLIVTLIGENVDMIEIEQSEIDRGEEFRSFFIPGNDECETLNLWYTRYFS